MRLPKAYCSLSHPSSVFEPSHPPNSLVGFMPLHGLMNINRCHKEFWIPYNTSIKECEWKNFLMKFFLCDNLMRYFNNFNIMDPSGLSDGLFNLIPVHLNPKPLPFIARSMQGQRSSRWATGPLWLLLSFDSIIIWFYEYKGGDPAAGSPTATLWRLNPPRWA